MSEIIKKDGETIIKPSMDINASMAENFKKELLSAIQECNGNLLIDLTEVHMIDSIGIGVIIAAHNTLDNTGKKLKIINASEDIFGLFSTMRLNRVLTVEEPA